MVQKSSFTSGKIIKSKITYNRILILHVLYLWQDWGISL